MAKRTIDEQKSYNKLFLIVASLFAAVSVWAVYDETVSRREYKEYQEDFFEIQADLAKQKYESLKAELEANTEYQELVAAKEAIEAELKGPKAAEIQRLEGELVAKKQEEFDRTQDWTFTKAMAAEQDYYWRLARHEYLQDPSNAAKRAKNEQEEAAFHALTKRIAEDEKNANEATAAREAVEAELAAVKRSEDTVKITKRLEVLRRPHDEAKRAYEKAKAQKGGLLGAATEVVQLDLPRIGKVDRCVSCHLGTTRGGFEEVTEKVFKSHTFRRAFLGVHPPGEFGCTSCHDGQGRATTKFFAHAPGPDEDPHAFHTHYWEFPLLKGPPGGDGTEYMESKCRGCHQESELRSTIPCSHDIECLPLSTAAEGEEPNVVCMTPKAEGRAAAQASLATLPGTPGLEAEGDGDGDGDGDEEGDEEPTYCSTKPVRTRGGEALVVDLAPNYTKGLKIVEEAGCYGCHPIAGFESKGKPAPALVRISHKLDPSYAVSWIEDPKAHRPNTRMPKFWPMLEDPDIYPYSVDVDAETKRRREESTAIAAFLFGRAKKSSKYMFELEPIPAGLVGDAERGKLLVEGNPNPTLDNPPTGLGCTGCHDTVNEAMNPERLNRGSHFDHGPNLADVGDKTTLEWLYAWVRNPRRYAPAARMPNLRLTPQEALDVATYLKSQRGDVKFAKVDAAQLEDEALQKTGETLVRKYGCYGCHLVEGFEDEPGIGADLSAFGVKLPERLDFGDYITDHYQQTWDNWTVTKLRHPRVYSYSSLSPVETRMPEFGFSEEEIRAVMVFLRSLRGEEQDSDVLGHKLTGLDAQRERGREIVRWYNCYGCHNVDGHLGELSNAKRFKTADFAIYAPPPLTNQGFKTQPDWLFTFLKAPFRMRPLPRIRMPTFGFTDEEATALAAMFSNIDGVAFPFAHYADVGTDTGPESVGERRIGKALFDAAGCQKCHVVGALGDGPVPPEVKAPNLLMSFERFRPHWTELWLADPNAMQAGTAMPAFWLGGNQMEMFMQTNPEFQAAVQGVDPAIVERYTKSPQLQIRAVRDYLYWLGHTGGERAAAPAAPVPAP